MVRKLLRSKGLLALMIPVLAVGAAYAGGADCAKKHGAAAVAAGKGAHCNLMAKQVVKTAEMTDDGAVVTLEGKSAKAVEHIQTHMRTHEKGEACADCPMSWDGVSASVKVTDKGGVVTFSASDDKMIQAVQDWAKKPGCCGEKASA